MNPVELLVFLSLSFGLLVLGVLSVVSFFTRPKFSGGQEEVPTYTSIPRWILEELDSGEIFNLLPASRFEMPTVELPDLSLEDTSPTLSGVPACLEQTLITKNHRLPNQATVPR